MKKILLTIISLPLFSQEIVDETINTQVNASNESVALQSKIDELDIESKRIYFDYKDTLNEYKSLKNYDDQLSKIIDAQIEEMKSINNQIDSLDTVNIDILPLDDILAICRNVYPTHLSNGLSNRLSENRSESQLFTFTSKEFILDLISPVNNICHVSFNK